MFSPHKSSQSKVNAIWRPDHPEKAQEELWEAWGEENKGSW